MLTAKFHVALITPKSTGIGGIAQHVRSLCKWLIRKGWYCSILSGERIPYINVKGVMNLSLTITMSLYASLDSLLGKRSEYDVVHVHHVFCMPVAKIYRKPTLLTLHGDFLQQEELLYGARISTMLKFLELFAIKAANGLTAVSPYIARKYAKRYGRRVVYIPNAVDLEELPRDNKKSFRFVAPGEIQIAFVGRLSPEKGVDVLLKAYMIVKRKYTGTKLVIAGGGPLTKLVKSISRKHKDIVYVGVLPRTEALRLIRDSDIIVLPSKAEGFPTVILEALAMGTPVVVSQLPEIEEVLGEKALYCRPNDPRDLALKILYLIRDENLRTNLARNGRYFVEKTFSWERVIELYISIYKSLIQNTQLHKNR